MDEGGWTPQAAGTQLEGGLLVVPQTLTRAMPFTHMLRLGLDLFSLAIVLGGPGSLPVELGLPQAVTSRLVVLWGHMLSGM